MHLDSSVNVSIQYPCSATAISYPEQPSVAKLTYLFPSNETYNGGKNRLSNSNTKVASLVQVNYHNKREGYMFTSTLLLYNQTICHNLSNAKSAG